MHKAFPLPVIEFPLPEKVPTASEESSHCQKKRDATAEKIALLMKSSSNSQSKSYDNYANDEDSTVSEKSFPLLEFPLLELFFHCQCKRVPTASEEVFPLLS
nr:hypothetical protein [Tanacetum cinerariifolium]